MFLQHCYNKLSILASLFDWIINENKEFWQKFFFSFTFSNFLFLFYSTSSSSKSVRKSKIEEEVEEESANKNVESFLNFSKSFSLNSFYHALFWTEISGGSLVLEAIFR